MSIIVLIYFFISIIASVVGAISGIGGGVIIKPLLDLISPMSVASVGFLSGSTVLSMTASSLIRNRKSDIKLDKRIGSQMAAGAIVGGLIGKFLFDMIKAAHSNELVIGVTQSSLLLLMTAGVFVFTLNKEKIKPLHIKNSGFCLLTGIILGCFASFLGIGGGPINLAVLYFFFAMDSKRAALTSLYIIFFSQVANLIFTFSGSNIPPFNLLTLVLMIVGGISGGMIGSKLLGRMTHKDVDRLFCVVMAIIICICIYNIVKWFI